MSPTVLALALVVGVVLGLLGGGGSILLVPLLVYVADLGAHEAIATSLFVVAVTAAVAAVPHARAGRVRWRVAALFGAGGVVGAYLGGLLGSRLDETVLLLAFAAMMAATAIAMLRKREAPAPSEGPRPVLRVLAEGAAVGAVTGLVGAGGGFLVVPALVLLGGLPMPAAVGTSLVVIAAKSLAGLGGHLSNAAIDWPFAVGLAVATATGAVLGARAVGRIPSGRLQQSFAWFVLVAAGAIVIGEA